MFLLLINGRPISNPYFKLCSDTQTGRRDVKCQISRESYSVAGVQTWVNNCITWSHQSEEPFLFRMLRKFDTTTLCIGGDVVVTLTTVDKKQSRCILSTQQMKPHNVLTITVVVGSRPDICLSDSSSSEIFHVK